MNKETVIDLNLNPYFKETIETNIVVWSHDKNSYRFNFNLFEYLKRNPFYLIDGEPRIILEFLNSKNQAVHIYPLDIDDAVKGLAHFIVPDKILGYQGYVKASITVDFEDKTHDLGNFTFEMKRSAIDKEEIDLENYVKEFDEAKKEIDKKKEEIETGTDEISQKLKEIEDTTNEKVDEIKDLIVQNDVLKKAEAGSFEDFREHDDTIISKMKNEFEDRGVNVKWFGTKGDGITDDTNAIKKAVEFCEQGKILYFPQGDYLTTDTIVIDKAIHLNMQGKIICNHNKTGISYLNSNSSGTFGPAYNDEVIINSSFNVIRKKEFSIDSNSIGIEIVNCFNGKFDFKNISGHYSGVKLIAKKIGNGYPAITYCNFKIGRFHNYFENVRGVCEDSGWLTQNTFFGGNWSNDNPKNGTRHVTFENNGTSVINSNLFFNCSFEGFAKDCITFKNAQSNTFYNCRFEMPTCEKLFHYSKESRFNVISNCYGTHAYMRENKFSDNEDSKISTGNKVEFNDYLLGDVNYYDGLFYITPIRSTDGYYGDTTNGVKLDNIPKKWNVKYNVSGLIENRINANSSNAPDGKISVDFTNSDKIYINSPSYNLSECHIKIDRNNSKIFYLSIGLAKDAEVLLTSDIGIADKTSSEKKFKYGLFLMEMYFDVYRNTIVITRTF